ncbi:MAG: hypothetical protein MUF15_17010, partial [Acidobacteria bacterium]|nr:hypothetical protein [Acidobacteriota bacterium]
MNKTLKKTMFQSAIGLVLIFSLSSFGCPYLTYNWRECLNSPGCTCEGVTSDLSNYIVDSSGCFLNSHAAYLTFLNRVELAETKGININEFKIILNSAIENMEKSKAMYG